MSSSILVVEDDEELRPMLVSILEDEGYEVCEAPSGERALQRVRETFFDLIITDVRMEGMDGLETAEAIHMVQPDVPVIVVTGYAQDNVPLRAMRQGVFDYLHKPFQLRELIICVERALNNQKLLDEIARQMSGVENSFFCEVDQERARVFQKFYVGVRSGGLDAADAFGVWEMMQRAEGGAPEDYFQAERALDVASFSLRLGGEETQIAEDFLHFLSQIKEGKVSQHEMLVASALRDLPIERLQRGAPELAQVRAKLWG